MGQYRTPASYFEATEALMNAKSNQSKGDLCIVGTTAPFKIFQWDGVNWFLMQPENGLTLYHTARWFTPTGTVSVTTGTTVTSVGTQFTASMVGAKVTINGESRIISAYVSTTQVTVSIAFSTNYTLVSAANWGVYGIALTLLSNGTFQVRPTNSNTGTVSTIGQSIDLSTDNVYVSTPGNTGDVLDDIRLKKSNGSFIVEKCIVPNSTKGSGTWVEISRINNSGDYLTGVSSKSPISEVDLSTLKKVTDKVDDIITNKLNKALPLNKVYVGNASGIAEQVESIPLFNPSLAYEGQMYATPLFFLVNAGGGNTSNLKSIAKSAQFNNLTNQTILLFQGVSNANFIVHRAYLIYKGFSGSGTVETTPSVITLSTNSDGSAPFANLNYVRQATGKTDATISNDFISLANGIYVNMANKVGGTDYCNLIVLIEGIYV